MRVLWITKGLGPGGAEHLLVAAARAHGASADAFECAYVLSFKDHLAGDLEAAGVKTQCLSLRRTDWRWPARLVALVRSGDYDVIHVHSPLPGSIARLAARSMRSGRPRIVATEHNRWRTHRLPTRLLNRLTSRWNDVTVAVTAEVAASVRGAAQKHVQIVRHGIEVDRVALLTDQRSAVRAELGLGANEFVVGTVANFRPQKDYPNLLAAARVLADRDVAVRFVAVGQGPDEAEIRVLRDELGLADRVVLTGYRADAVRVMAGCDTFVIASQWEGLPVAVMEALALGLPVVATDVGGMAEELTNEVDALLVPPRNAEALAAAIERVATDDSLRASLAAASVRRSADFDVRRSVKFYEEAYRASDRALATASPSPDLARSSWSPSSSPSPSRSTPRTRPASSDVDIRPAEADDRDDVLSLLGRSLGADADDPRYRALFHWKHDLNRFGPSPMWVATSEGKVVAFRALMRWEFERGGRVLRAVRAVDTATDPEFQGQGLFTKLTMRGLEEMRAEGVDFVFNTPNSQSRPGYLKMGWREVGKLPAAFHVTGPTGAMRVARARVPAERWSLPITVGRRVEQWLAEGGHAHRPPPTDVRAIQTRIDDDYLAWRFGGDLLHYRVVTDGATTVIVRARRRGPATELALVAAFGEQRQTDRLARRTAREVGADYVIRIGQPQMSSGWLPLPGGGPVLTWRALTDPGPPPLPNWALSLGDVELF